MFRRFAQDASLSSRPAQAAKLFSRSVLELRSLMEMGWAFRMDLNDVPVGDPRNRSDFGMISEDEFIRVKPLFDKNHSLFTIPATTRGTNSSAYLSDYKKDAYKDDFVGAVIYDHLFYAMLMEVTGIEKAFEEAIKRIYKREIEFNPRNGAMDYVHKTAALWFNGWPFDSPVNPFSTHRPDLQQIKDQAFYRMFGWRQSSSSNGQAGDMPSPQTNYVDFYYDFEELAREWWIGFSNQDNTTGSNPTDTDAIRQKAEAIRRRLLAQRDKSFMSLDEYYLVCRASWFHLSLEAECPLLAGLGIKETSAAQSAIALGNKVGVPVHQLSETILRMLDPGSEIMNAIETGIFEQQPTALYAREFGKGTGTVTANPIIPERMGILVNGWAALTGRDLKARNVASVTAEQRTKPLVLIAPLGVKRP